ncbi:hypothetical protein FRACYDRAFT_263714 [Fragilariopsis cylindrus CCMP1102]|uniref:Peptidase M23 domain-containing protein n=1 Tax=Fragilariopsis cylindrus CCMP1102 TaxID=635003 RepID=A0A1E7EXP7_9STRA|nr:hypothetical protein FRACYDRAFT_263714 [Fragilariopsis cylindrus CCMP1102]|eukprot:OEU10810.1 hypothetical protein FRACYDRAFT_263714 [Fragilariopsis cylindrus CCMP1102]
MMMVVATATATSAAEERIGCDGGEGRIASLSSSSSSSSTTAVGEVTEESIIAATATATATAISNITTTSNNNNSNIIPLQFDAPFGSYPNLLNISAEERNSFSPIIIYPKWVQSERSRSKRSRSNNKNETDYYVHDKRQASEELASPEAILIMKHQRRRLKEGRWPLLLLLKERVIWFSRSLIGQIRQSKKMLKRWNIGKYDENRDGGMYVSDLFDDTTNKIDGYGGQRTIHLGIDLGGPVGTNIYSFSDGIIHSIGYNPLLGDYGNVIVIEHSWDTYYNDKIDKIDDNTDESTTESTATTTTNATSKKKKCWTLYGHLDELVLTTARTTKHDDSRTSIKRKRPQQRQRQRQPGDIIKKGEIIGRIGNIDENGGWIHSHLHFQVSMKPPDQPHDMPGASSLVDRNIALQQYFDPRYILGPIY